jgi:hypothetical protein
MEVNVDLEHHQHNAELAEVQEEFIINKVLCQLQWHVMLVMEKEHQ